MAKNTGIVKANSNTQLAEPMEDWEKALADKARKVKAATVVGIPRIGHRGGVLKIDDKKVENNKLQVVILTGGRMNTYFEKEFDQETSKGETPDCYAFGPLDGSDTDMVVHPAAPDKQSPKCQGCKWNEFGSGKGNAKKCGNYYKLLVVVPTNDPESMATAQVRQISVPPGSLRPFGNYLGTLEDVTPYGMVGVVTEISTEALDTGAYKLTFKAKDPLEKQFMGAIAKKIPDLERHLNEPFPVVAKKESEAPAPKQRRFVKGQGR
jgi:hypothetical protein